MEQVKQISALLVMDMQTAVLRNLPNSADLTKKAADAINIARARKIPVLYVVVGFRPGMPEVSPNNKIFAASRERMVSANMDEWMKIDVSITPVPGDIIITKRRVSAFTGSDLEVVLRALGIQHIILSGVATGGVVLSTLREAADKDFRITVLSDCCADADSEVHNILMLKVFPRQSDVFTLDEWSRKQ
jgi:nicotinamidase-related amidase